MKMLSNRIFLIIFFALLVIPGLGFKTGEIKLADNRMAANFPAVRITKDDGKIKRNKNFTTDAENYINDRIGGRDLMIKLHSMFAMMQSDRMTKDVLRGKNGFLFLGWDVSIESYANRTKLSEGQLENIKNYFDSVQRECKKSNIKFAFAIAPDKSKIYKENYPSLVKKLRPDSESAANQITEYLTGNLSAPYLYLADVLLANKEKGLLYYKYDTHWNHLGAYIGFGAMMRALGISFPQFNAQQKPGQAEDLYAMLNNNFYPKDNET
jgi:hypothetical protein